MPTRRDEYTFSGEAKACHCVFQPGNGTRYELVLVKGVAPDQQDIFIWTNAPGYARTAVLGCCVVEAGWLGEKLNHHNRHDLAALLSWLDDRGWPVRMPRDFGPNGLVRGCNA